MAKHKINLFIFALQSAETLSKGEKKTYSKRIKDFLRLL